MLTKWTTHFKPDLHIFDEATKKFFAKELSPSEYKGTSGGFGAYGERGANTLMYRLRFSSGIVTADDLKALLELIPKYNVPMVHFTTCQSIQLHHITEEKALPLIHDLYDHGILTRGGGSDFPRNITGPALTGVDPNEYFDVRPYMEAAGEQLLSYIGQVTLPRKLKVSFSNSPDNTPHTSIRDLGFVGNANGTFDVYSIGGLGPNPKLGVKCYEQVPADQILYYIDAFIATWTILGDYKNRAKNRTRYLQVTPGLIEYQKLFEEKLAQAKKKDLTIKDITVPQIHKTGQAKGLTHPRIHNQKQAGLYYVDYHPIGGTPTVAEFLDLAKAIVAIPEAELRLAADETAYIVNLTADQALQIAKLTDTVHTAKTAFEKSVSCVGATVCQIGLQDSHGLLEAILAAAKPYQFKDGILPRLYISGCHNSCGTHEVGTIGLQGAFKPVDGKPQPAFQLHYGGSAHFGKETFGQHLGTLLATVIPQFIVALGEKVQASGLDFLSWDKAHHDDFLALIKDYE